MACSKYATGKYNNQKYFNLGIYTTMLYCTAGIRSSDDDRKTMNTRRQWLDIRINITETETERDTGLRESAVYLRCDATTGQSRCRACVSVTVSVTCNRIAVGLLDID